MIGLINTGACNLASFGLALERLDCPFVTIDNPDQLAQCDKLVLPGVGSFGAAAGNLEERNLVPAIRRRVTEDNIPILGICLGMHLLFSGSEEKAGARGIGILDGKVSRLSDKDVARVPNIGWDHVDAKKGSRLFSKTSASDHFYFSHSYYCQPADDAVASAYLGDTEVCCAVESDHIFGVQFHPEKSHKAGLILIDNFLEY